MFQKVCIDGFCNVFFISSMPTGLKTNGLRRYARCVCNKVKEKGVTSYSEVADELVHEYAAEHPMIPSEQVPFLIHSYLLVLFFTMSLHGPFCFRFSCTISKKISVVAFMTLSTS